MPLQQFLPQKQPLVAQPIVEGLAWNLNFPVVSSHSGLASLNISLPKKAIHNHFNVFW
jgi:hypothetical protein